MITMGNGALGGFMSTGKPSIAREIVAVPVGLLVLAIGLPILIVVEAVSAVRGSAKP